MEGAEKTIDDIDPSLLSDDLYQQLFLVSSGRIDLLTKTTAEFLRTASTH